MSANRIKVICADRMCFDVDAETLEPLNCGSYDAWAFSDPEPVPTLMHADWCLQLARKEDRT